MVSENCFVKFLDCAKLVILLKWTATKFDTNTRTFLSQTDVPIYKLI